MRSTDFVPLLSDLLDYRHLTRAVQRTEWRSRNFQNRDRVSVGDGLAIAGMFPKLRSNFPAQLVTTGRQPIAPLIAIVEVFIPRAAKTPGNH
ncbi:MAG: hypothetical protein HC890_00570 [Chloroflexaceae bacterium]|nr:hypothetical protein [Chloroflexaceae bacterium]